MATKKKLIVPPVTLQDILGCERARLKGEPTFTLVAHDRTAPAIIREWTTRASRLGAGALKIGTALSIAVEMEAWQQIHGSKIPD